MRADLLVKVLAAIDPEKVIPLDKFQQACGISSKSVAKTVLDYLEINNIGSVSNNMVRFSVSDRIHAAVLALQMRGDIEQVSTYLSWTLRSWRLKFSDLLDTELGLMLDLLNPEWKLT
jgi:hypothetical protein